MHTYITRLFVALASAALVFTGCGSDDSSSTDAAASGSTTGKLTHVDGTIAVSGDGFELTPKNGDAAKTFTLGPEVQIGAVKALEASGVNARVTYRDGDALVAASVTAAPTIDESLDSFVGTIVSVDSKQITLTGDDGERTFDISGADADAFDVAHLKDHASENSPVRVYFDPQTPKVGVTYEDA